MVPSFVPDRSLVSLIMPSPVANPLRPSIRRHKKSAFLGKGDSDTIYPLSLSLLPEAPSFSCRIPTAQYDGLWHGGTWLIQVQLITVVCLIAWAAVSSYVILWVSTGSPTRLINRLDLY